MNRDAPARTRGRPRQFDEDTVLDALTALFWRKGYEATSVSDIVEASGLNKSSLYNAFGSKPQLFALVLDRYLDQRMQTLATMVESIDGGVESLHAFLDGVRAEIDSPMGRQGCLAINTSAELGSSDADIVAFGLTYRTRMRAALADVVSNATDKGGLDPDLVEPRADLLLAFMLGVSVAVRGGADTVEIDRLLAAGHDMVDSWTAPKLST